MAVLLSAGLMVLLVPFARVGVDMHHDGIMLKPALDVLSGQILFRDTFMQYGALTCYIQVAVLWLQPTLLALKYMTVAVYGATLFVLYAAWRQILPQTLAIGSSFLFILFIPCYERFMQDNQYYYWVLLPWSSVLAMLFQSVGLYGLLRVIQGIDPVRWGLVSGMACAGVFWCRQPVGVVMFASLVAIWLALHWTKWELIGHSKRSIVAGFCGGLLLVSVPLLLGILISDAQPEWWYQNYVWPQKYAQDDVVTQWSGLVAKLVRPVAGVQLLVLVVVVSVLGGVKKVRWALTRRSRIACGLLLGAGFAWQPEHLWGILALHEGGWKALLPLVVFFQAVMCGIRALVHREKFTATEDYLIAALSVFSLGSLLQYFPVPDSWHILWSLAPAFGLVVFVFWRWSGWRPLVLAGMLMGALLPFFWSETRSAIDFYTLPKITLTKPSVLRGCRVSPEQAQTIKQIVDVIERVEQLRPGIPSVLIGRDALPLCFTGNRRNPSPYFVTWRGLVPAEENARRVGYIFQVRPLLFLSKTDWQWADDFYRQARYVPLLHVAVEGLEISVPQELAQAAGLAAASAGSAQPPRVD